MNTLGVRNHFVYRVFDADGDLLYIGCTKNFERRWREQKVDRPKMTAAATRCKLSGPYTYETARRLEAEAIEAEAIEAENPLHNFTLARRRERAEHSRIFDNRFYGLLDLGATSDQAAQILRREGLLTQAMP